MRYCDNQLVKFVGANKAQLVSRSQIPFGSPFDMKYKVFPLSDLSVAAAILLLLPSPAAFFASLSPPPLSSKTEVFLESPTAAAPNFPAVLGTARRRRAFSSSRRRRAQQCGKYFVLSSPFFFFFLFLTFYAVFTAISSSSSVISFNFVCVASCAGCGGQKGFPLLSRVENSSLPLFAKANTETLLEKQYLALSSLLSSCASLGLGTRRRLDPLSRAAGGSKSSKLVLSSPFSSSSGDMTDPSSSLSLGGFSSLEKLPREREVCCRSGCFCRFPLSSPELDPSRHLDWRDPEEKALLLPPT